MPTHITVSGHEITYEPNEEVAAFIDRVVALAAKKTTKEADLVALVYSRENPILDKTLFPERGAVTKAVLDHPVYGVLMDLLARKRLEQDKVDVASLGEEYTLSPSDAAKVLGVNESAIRQAIDARRLPSWKRDGRHWLKRDHVLAFQLGTRGPKKTAEPERGSNLTMRFGHAKGLRMRVFTGMPVFSVDQTEQALDEKPQIDTRRDGDTNVVYGELVEPWTTFHVLVAVERAGKKTHRYFLLRPSHAQNELSFVDGLFYVKGRFRIAEEVTNDRAALEHWKQRESDGYLPVET
jgi:excisionase family DNA binding protein